jgi:hypothetical protein
MEHYVCPACGGVSDHEKQCETTGCTLQGEQLKACDCTDEQHEKVKQGQSTNQL